MADTPSPGEQKAPSQRTRKSIGLTQFVSSIHDQAGLSVLDLGGISQANVSFLTDLGHRLYTVDFLRTLDSVSVPEDPPGGPSQRNRMESFLDQTLGYQAHSLDGVLVWDVLPFLSRPLLYATVERLHDVLRPDSYMLAMFHTDEKARTLPVYSYRLQGHDMLYLSLRGYRKPIQTFNNRDIEQLFKDFRSVKFFLTRDNLREVIVSR